MQDLEFRNLVERVKLRSPIEVVVAQRVGDLKKKGALWWSRCPFHEERTPSFAVDPRRGTWRCYGACSEGGDVLSFVQRFDGLDFLDALRLLAREAGEELDENAFRASRGRGLGIPGIPAPNEAREKAYRVLAWAARFYRERWQGSEGTAARAYLARRGFTPEIAETFGVGWAPDTGSPLLEAARKLETTPGLSSELLIRLGLAKKGTGGPRPYDFFRGRLMIPIRDRLGRVLGFGGRLLEERTGADGRPVAKYVNTPETPLFHKGRVIYGLDLAMAAARKSRELLLVEGYTDVMAAHQAGFTTACAVLGTSTTEDHAALIRRTGVRRVTLVFDGDAAGRAAAQKALQGLLPLELEVRVAALPPGNDPGDLLVNSEGRAEFERRLEAAPEWFDALLEDLRGLTGSELSTAVEERFGLLLRLKPVDRATRVDALARFLGLPAGDVQAQWRNYVETRRRTARRENLDRPVELVPSGRPSGRSEGPATAPEARDEAQSRLEPVFEQLLGALLLDNSLIPLYADLEDKAPPGELAATFRALLELYEDEEDERPIDAARLISGLGAHPARERVMALLARAERAESPEALARDQKRWLERQAEEAEVLQLRANLTQTVHSSGVDETAKAVLRTLHEKLRQGRVPRSPVPNLPDPHFD